MLVWARVFTLFYAFVFFLCIFCAVSLIWALFMHFYAFFTPFLRCFTYFWTILRLSCAVLRFFASLVPVWVCMSLCGLVWARVGLHELIQALVALLGRFQSFRAVSSLRLYVFCAFFAFLEVFRFFGAILRLFLRYFTLFLAFSRFFAFFFMNF